MRLPSSPWQVAHAKSCGPPRKKKIAFPSSKFSRIFGWSRLTAIVTPVDAQDQFNEAAMREQIDRQIAAGNGIFCGGTNGEFFALTESEKRSVAEVTMDQVAGRASVVGHVGEVSTAECVRVGRHIASLGVDAIAAITPWFVPLSQDDLHYHFSTIADALDVPVYLYNIPARTGNTITPETALRLAAHPNIAGIKDSAGTYESLTGFLNVAKQVPGFAVFNGPDSLIHQGFVDGCTGAVSGLADAVAKLKGVESVAVSAFSRADIVRHALVGRIVAAYDKKVAKPNA